MCVIQPVIEKVSLSVCLLACICVQVLNIDVSKCGAWRKCICASVCVLLVCSS